MDKQHPVRGVSSVVFDASTAHVLMHTAAACLSMPATVFFANAWGIFHALPVISVAAPVPSASAPSQAVGASEW